MALTEFQKLFKNTLLKITDNIEEIHATYLVARKDEVRQEIIDKINSGKIKRKEDIYEITKKMSPVYQYEEKKAKIQEILKNLEKDNDIKIIFAVENGSRAWGMASIDSDYDVRFVYTRSLENYVSLHPQKDVINIAFDKDMNICEPHGSLIDISGFDIFKYLKLLESSNPTSIEWLNSQFVYMGDNNIPLKKYMNTHFNQEKLFKHYFSLFHNNYKEYALQGKKVTYKKYLYCMRGLLNAKYVYEFDKVPPLPLLDVANEMKNFISEDVYKRLREVINIKVLGFETDITLNTPEFDNFFEVELQKEYLKFNKRKPDTKVLNKFLQEKVCKSDTTLQN